MVPVAAAAAHPPSIITATTPTLTVAAAEPPPPASTPTPPTSRNSLFDVNTSSWSPEPAPRLSTTPRRTTTPYRAASRSSPPPPLCRQYQATTPPPPFVSPPTSPLGPAPGMAPAPTPAPPGSSTVLGVADSTTMKAAHNRLSGEYYASPPPPLPPAPVASGSKTSSFFASAAADTPPPPPRLSVPLAPSPLTLSRASSLRSRALPSLPSPPPPADPDDCPPSAGLSPLHQSPSLPPTSCWLPPRPPAADHIELRLYPEPTYLLGEGRYACVYLAAYKELGGGHHPNEWTLAAAKRMAPDRESQTMGLREAFFLNRLGAAPAQRATSPLRSTTAGGAARNTRRGRVYVVKLIAVKEDSDGAAAALQAHSRSKSDQAADGGPASSSSSTRASSGAPPHGTLRRPRSSTINASNRPQDSGSHPNLPQLQGTSVGAALHPSVSPSRLVLVLEHAPLGTLDRLLRTSPGLVGEQLWGRWAREATEALEWVHSRGVVHADVKPSNLLLTADLHLRLSDFGSSLLVHPLHPPTDGVGLGTLPFSPPELVDPTKPFSFPVDIFALGATLYQCITGREPYRGSRPMEIMHHVRSGALWVWEENQRLNRIGTTPALGTGAGGSPYPSAWHDDFMHVPANDKSLLRTGSLRVPMNGSSTSRGSIVPASGTTPFGVLPLERPGLNRVGSAESLKASEDVIAADSSVGSPSAVKLWHKWVKSADERGGGGAHHARCMPIERLLRPDDAPPSPPTSPASPIVGSPGGAAGVSRSSSLRSAVSVSRAPSIRSPKFRHASSHSNGSNNAHQGHLSPNASPTSSTGAGSSGFAGLSSQTHAALAAAAAALIEPVEAYPDGSPAMFFLGDGGGVRVPEDVRGVLRAMLDPVPEMRPTAADVVGAWDQLEVGVGETEND